MDLHLKGKTALVTGSTAGIGRAIALMLADEGVVVGINGRQSLAAAETLCVDIASRGGGAYVALGDLATDAGADRVAAAARAAVGNVDILVNNAGAYPLGGWWDGQPSAWLDTYNTDVVAGVRMIQRLAPEMRSRGWGRVIQISSVGGVTTPSNYFPMYACAKAAQTWMAGCLAAELTGTGITVNTVSPGPVATDTFRSIYTQEAAREGRSTNWADVEREYIERYMQDPPVKRLSTVDEVASVVALLASPRADTITGANYVVDGGYAITGWRRQVSTVEHAE
jgi:3-oxoacyl-[acyl-carrier protein] reductase